jgi:3-hydroxyisobutyrate dehydrogenase
MRREGPRVGFIGLGSQGAPMARAIVEAGFPTTLWARRPESLEPFSGSAEIADSPASLARRVDVIGVCVLADADVEEVVVGEDGLLDGLRPGAVVAIHSTVHPDTCARVATAVARVGADVLDAPVSGGAPAVESRRLLVMVGGDPGVLERARPVLSSFGNPIVHLGPIGAGQMGKLVNNVLFTSTMSLAHQAIRLASSLELDPDALIAALSCGSSRSYALETYRGFRTQLGVPGSPVEDVAMLLGKDLELLRGLEAARQVDAELLTDCAAALIEEMAGRGAPPAPSERGNGG